MRLSLYVHIPFCVRKCAYCDFASGPVGETDMAAYAAAVVGEMEMRSRLLAEPPETATLYFGGGTPSLLAPELVSEIIAIARERYLLRPDAEITLEANPGTVTPASLAGFRRAGVNRLSLGVQSLDDGMLALLGRVHTAAEARTAFRWARDAGFANIGIDLIHSLPGQTVAAWRDQLREALTLHPEHLAAYGLTLEEGTSLHQREQEGGLILPDEETAARMYVATGEMLAAAGLEQYEISNYARPGRRSRHNQVYWHRGCYLGFGAAAHSFLTTDDTPFGRRWRNPLLTDAYLRAMAAGDLADEEVTLLTRQDAMAETLFLGLRTVDGVDTERFRSDFGEEIDRLFGDAVESLINNGLLRREGGRLFIPTHRLILSNQVLHRFV